MIYKSIFYRFKIKIISYTLNAQTNFSFYAKKDVKLVAYALANGCPCVWVESV
jgi:hypothetical protein